MIFNGCGRSKHFEFQVYEIKDQKETEYKRKTRISTYSLIKSVRENA